MIDWRVAWRLRWPALLAMLLVVGVPEAVHGQIAGTWDVIGVAIDRSSGRRQTFAVNDLRLVGRRLTFNADSIGTNADEGGCHAPRYRTQVGAAGALFAAALGKKQDGTVFRPIDFGFDISPATRLNLVSVSCKPELGGGTYDGGAPLFMLSPTEAILGWNDDALLRLRKRSADGVARPSFACARAADTAEKAICASVDLAALDASLGRAYAQSIAHFEREDPAKVAGWRSGQRSWILERRRCGARNACLERAMRQRIAQLVAVGE